MCKKTPTLVWLGGGLTLWLLLSSDSKKAPESMSTFGKRMSIVNTALAELGQSDSSRYGAPPGVDWCGIFILWDYHQNGILTDVRWAFAEDVNKDGLRDFGFLMVQPKPLLITKNPEPGDVAYFTKNQHHALVQAVRGDKIDIINGNGLGGKVTLATVNRSQVAAFFSIAPYLKESEFPNAIV